MSQNKQTAFDLLNQAHEQFDIEYGGYLSNHMTHGIAALKQMNANPQRLKEWYKAYAVHKVGNSQLEPAKPESENFGIDDRNWMDFIGKKKCFPELFKFFQSEIHAHGLDRVLDLYVPQLSNGIAASAMHPIIHLGFALDVDSVVMIAEGLAYMVYSNVPMFDSKREVYSLNGPEYDESPHGIPLTLTEISTLAYEDNTLWNLMRQDSRRDTFQENMLLLKDYSDILFKLLSRWEVLSERPLNKEKQDDLFERTCKELAVTAAYTFLHTVPPAVDFFLLHGVTGAFGAIQVAQRLSSHEERMRLLFHFTFSLLATYVIQGMPNTVANCSMLRPSCRFSSWEEIFDEYRKPGSNRNGVHGIKLAYVCKYFCDRYGDQMKLWFLTAGCCAQEEEETLESAVGLTEDPVPR